MSRTIATIIVLIALILSTVQGAPLERRRGGGHGGPGGNSTRPENGNSTRPDGVLTLTLSDGTIFTTSLPKPSFTGSVRPTGTPSPIVLTVTGTSGAVETVTLAPPPRGDGHGPHGGPGGNSTRPDGAFTVTLSDGTVFTTSLPKPSFSGSARPTGTPSPIILTLTGTSGAVETVTLAPPARNGTEGGHGKGGKGGKSGTKSGKTKSVTTIA